LNENQLAVLTNLFNGQNITDVKEIDIFNFTTAVGNTDILVQALNLSSFADLKEVHSCKLYQGKTRNELLNLIDFIDRQGDNNNLNIVQVCYYTKRA
jgi:hypothetical protein